ncbi:hypothetical protein [Halobaculum marinum]|uniref:Uncharacterized protein n=1 Tax=Halobaculum marinum TaxID=3031996 RepID=A0ABD5WUB1_9EURY|nr:hypothetical protein [Halobaculum sp. DT55]
MSKQQKAEAAGLGLGIVSLLGTFVSMLDPTFLISTADLWYPMVSYTARYGPDIPGIPMAAVLTVATTVFVSAMAYRLYERRKATQKT